MTLFSDPNPIRLPLTFASPAEGVALVKQGETDFDIRLDEAAAAICADCVERGIRVIRLSGPTCAGKTTTAAKLTECLRAHGHRGHVVSLDDFYYDKEYLPPRRKSGKRGVTYSQPQSGCAIAYDYALKNKKRIINVFSGVK